MIAAPFINHRGEVLPGWVDDNGHMNLAYYLVMFDAASDAVFETLGIGQGYRQTADCTCFAAETHLVYEREMNVGDKARIHTTVIDVDAKRLHLAHEMVQEGKAARACLQEIMFVNVNLTTRRVVPWAAPVLENLQAALAVHNLLQRPEKLGRAIGIKR
ncbi:MAG: thioesterase family protein [Acidocella sp.]|nr:thioesterase family protein [Acidocella sp.]